MLYEIKNMFISLQAKGKNVKEMHYVVSPKGHSFSPSATLKLAPFTHTPSRGCLGWCDQGSLHQSAPKSSPTSHRSPGDPLTGKVTFAVAERLFLFILVTCWLHVCMYTYDQVQGVHGRPGVNTALLSACGAGCSYCHQTRCSGSSEEVHLRSGKGTIAWECSAYRHTLDKVSILFNSLFLS